VKVGVTRLLREKFGIFGESAIGRTSRTHDLKVDTLHLRKVSLYSGIVFTHGQPSSKI
jgi:hypothetical protein